MTIIGIYSPTPGCGKTTLAQFLFAKSAFSLAHPFAKPVKDLVVYFLMQYGYNKQDALDYAYCNKNVPLASIPGNPTARKLMQTIGTDWGRNMIHPDIWLEQWEQSLVRAGLTVVDDLRFPSEYYALTKRNAFLVIITRDSAPIVTHESEGRLDHMPFDYAIENNGTIENLKEHADHIWEAA